MLFDFTVNQAMYLALAREDARAARARAGARCRRSRQDCQWAHFVRNHDELTLDKLSEAEREEVFAAFGPTQDMQLYGRGLRRRLPTMLGGDERRIRLVYSLVFSLPGTPVLFYGEEIGMAENLAIEGRYAVRAPMQWSRRAARRLHDRRRAAPAAARRRAVRPRESTSRRSAATPDSLLNWMERLIRRRRECPELGWGAWRCSTQDDPAVFAHRADWDDSTVVAVHNLAARATRGRRSRSTTTACSSTCSATTSSPLDGALGSPLEPYGHRWFRLRRPGQRVAP